MTRVLESVGVSAGPAYGITYPWYFTLWLVAGVASIGIALRFIYLTLRKKTDCHGRHAYLASALSTANAAAICGLIASDCTGVWSSLRFLGILGSGFVILFLLPHLLGSFLIASAVSGIRDGSIEVSEQKYGYYNSPMVTVYRRGDPDRFWTAVVMNILFGLFMFGFGIMLAASLLGHIDLKPETQSQRRTSRAPRQVLELPSDGEVVEMRAGLLPKGAEAIPEFIVPPEHVPVILGWLRPPNRDLDPPVVTESDELGEVFIRTHSGQVLLLRFYRAGSLGKPAVVTRDGVNYFLGGRAVDDEGWPCDGGVMLGNAVRKAHRAARH